MENQILLEKIGETKTEKLLEDCNKIYMEIFTKKFPEYFGNNFTKSICKVLVTDPNDTEIKGIGMSCMNDLILKQFSQWLGGFLGFQSATTGDPVKDSGGASVGVGNSHGGTNFSHWGNINSAPNARGLVIGVGIETTPPLKDDFALPLLTLQLVVNAGSFNSGLGTVDWTAGGTAISDFTISSSGVYGAWSLASQPIRNYALIDDRISPTIPAFIGQSVFIDITFVFS